MSPIQQCHHFPSRFLGRNITATHRRRSRHVMGGVDIHVRNIRSATSAAASSSQFRSTSACEGFWMGSSFHQRQRVNNFPLPSSVLYMGPTLLSNPFQIRSFVEYATSAERSKGESVHRALNKFGHNYTHIGEPFDSSTCKLNEHEINNSIRGRMECKLAGDYKKADIIREQLMLSGIVIDDTLKQWRIDRKFIEFGHDYTKIGGPVDPSTCTLREYEIHNMIRDRMQCKLVGHFRKADEITENLNRNGVEVYDKQKQWRVGQRGRVNNGSSVGQQRMVNNGSGGGQQRREERPRLNKFGHDFTQLTIDPSIRTTAKEQEDIHNMIRERMQCRLAGNFRKADIILEQLRRVGVEIDDKSKRWRVDRHLIEFGHDYKQVGGSVDTSTCTMNEEEIHKMIRERIQCQLARNFQKADTIRTYLRNNSVDVDDKLKQWRVLDGGSNHNVITGNQQKLEVTDRQLNEFGHDYTQIGGPIVPSICKLKVNDIHLMIRGLILCRKVGNSEKEDTITGFLKKNSVDIDDKLKQWRADGGDHTTSKGEQHDQLTNEFGHDYTQVGGPIDPMKETVIRTMIREMIQCRKADSPQKEDAIRNYLRNVGVDIDDNLKQWRADGGGDHNDTLEEMQDDDHLNEFGHDYTQIGGTIEQSSCKLEETVIHSMIRERMQCQLARDYSKADIIREQLKHAGVELNDKYKQWRALDGVTKKASGPDLRNCGTIEDISQMAYDHLDVMSPRDMSAFWTLASKHLVEKTRSGREVQTEVGQQLEKILDHTLDGIGKYGYRDLAQATLGLAKIVKMIDNHGRTRPQHQILHDHFIGPNSERKRFIFDELATTSTHVLSEFEPRHLSNLIYAFGLAKHNLKFEDGSTFFDKVASQAISKLQGFNSQGLSNTIWAYANVETANSCLFREVGDVIVANGNLGDFWPQGLSNTVWAYATLDEKHPMLFKEVADHIAALDNLGDFSPQALSNIVWSNADLGENHPMLFKKIADHIVTLDDLRSFNGQDCANIVWAYATTNEPHPQLFEKVADHIIALDNLDSFNTQHLSNIVWAYATAKESNPQLFQKVAEAAAKRQHEFNSQGAANFLWAHATNGYIEKQIFQLWESTTASLVSEFSSQGLSNIAWAYAVADVAAPSLFTQDFINACLEKEDQFNLENHRQLHQWQLWQEEIKSNNRLPPSLQEKCYEAFVSRVPNPSTFQDDVISELKSIGLHPEEEVLTERGYLLDAMVEGNGIKVGIEVDGPSHFLDRKPTGSTILKHRQVTNLEGIQLVSVPYWEWNQVEEDSKKKQQYLRVLLELN